MFSLSLRDIILCSLLACGPLLPIVKSSTQAVEFPENILAEVLRLADQPCFRLHELKDAFSIHRLILSSERDYALSCLFELIKANTLLSATWLSLGKLYDSHNPELAKVCRLNSEKTNKKLVTSRRWDFIGPFIIGKGEVDGDPVESLGGIENIIRKNITMMESELVRNGQVSWQRLKADNSGMVTVQPDVEWSILVNNLGSMGITEWQGWLINILVVPTTNVNVIVDCRGIHTLYIDDIPLTGDVYHRHHLVTTIQLEQGLHAVRIRIRAKVIATFTCHFAPSQNELMILVPHYLPDLLGGQLFSSYIALPVINTSPLLIDAIALELIDSQSLGIFLKERFIAMKLWPGQIVTVNIEIIAPENFMVEDNDNIKFSIRLKTEAGSPTIPLSLRNRQRGDSFLITFIDHDGSVQHAAAIEPIKSCFNNLCPIVLSLHGTGVSPQDQANGYKRMEKGKFKFGVDRAWTLTPTRHGAHNWEGPGALTALASIRALVSIVDDAEWITCKASVHDVLFAGHSMGGHGAWHLATHFPDRAIALIALAGWISKENYGDSNLFFRHDVSMSSVSPSTKAVLESTVAENDAAKLVNNLRGLPVLVRVGAADRSVSPFYSRQMVRLLREANVNVSYHEVLGKEHWWWDTKKTNDGGAVNDEEIRNFMKEHTAVREMVTTCEKDTCGGHDDDSIFTLTSYNPAFGESIHGVKILLQQLPLSKSSIKISRNGQAVCFTTQNVAQFEIHPEKLKFFGKSIEVDGSKLFFPTAKVCYENILEGWQQCQKPTITPNSYKRIRNLMTLGPMRRISESPFCIVVGNHDAVDKSLLAKYAVYLANLYFLTSDAYAPIIDESNLTENIIKEFNLIVIGNNFHLTSLSPQDFKWHDWALKVGNCTFSDKNIGLAYLTTCSLDRLALFLTGSTRRGIDNVIRLATPTIPPMTRSPFSNLLPDFVVTGDKFRADGPGGYLCAGSWGNRWEFRRELSSCMHC